jgi:hypothetical protein
LIANQESVQVGNLLFDQFSYSPTGQMPTAASVNVNPIVDASGNLGLRFSGGFTDASDGPDAVQEASDAVLSYRVSAVGAAINDIHLFGNPQILGPGDGVMSVTETLETDTRPIQLAIYDSVSKGVVSLKLQDAAMFGPLPSLQVVTKDLFALNLGGFPTESFIDQTFSITIPEPNSGLVLGLAFLMGAAYLGGRRFRVWGFRGNEVLAAIDEGVL